MHKILLYIGGASGTYSKDASKSYASTIKDIYGNNASPTFPLSGDPTGITVDGGASGVGVDGYIGVTPFMRIIIITVF